MTTNGSIHVYTIGFTKKSAEQFFGKLADAGVKRIVDVRLRNTSQMAGFAKKDDLAYFAKAVAGIDYLHLPILAPSDDILDAYRKQKGPWSDYETAFLDLMAKRSIENELSPGDLDGGCLLCSEHEPKFCHRRLVAEYLDERWGKLKVEHLL